MPQSFETQVNRTGYPTAAGFLIILSGCLHIASGFGVSHGEGWWAAGPLISSTFLSMALGLVVSFMLGVFVLLGGVFALTRTRFIVAVSSISVIIALSLSNTAFAAGSLLAGGIMYPFSSIYYFTIPAIALVLSTLSLIFLAKSRPEFV